MICDLVLNYQNYHYYYFKIYLDTLLSSCKKTCFYYREDYQMFIAEFKIKLIIIIVVRAFIYTPRNVYETPGKNLSS